MPDTVIDGIDYGPLAGLIGTWKGDKGFDVAPEPDGIEENPYYETIVFEAGGDVDNAEEQNLAIVPYTQIVQRASNDEVFHHQTGYWLWDKATGTVMQTLTIPRAVSLVAGGAASGEGAAGGGGPVTLKVAARKGDPDWGVVEQPFMRDKASTLAFEHELTVDGDAMRYAETTTVRIYGGDFVHTDGNALTRQ